MTLLFCFVSFLWIFSFWKCGMNSVSGYCKCWRSINYIWCYDFSIVQGSVWYKESMRNGSKTSDHMMANSLPIAPSIPCLLETKISADIMQPYDYKGKPRWNLPLLIKPENISWMPTFLFSIVLYLVLWSVKGERVANNNARLFNLVSACSFVNCCTYYMPMLFQGWEAAVKRS